MPTTGRAGRDWASASMSRGVRAFSARSRQRSRSACVSASRSARPRACASAAAALVSASNRRSGRSGPVSTWWSVGVSGDDRSLVRRMDSQSSSASGVISHAPELSRIDRRCPDANARMTLERPHPARLAACLGESMSWSMLDHARGPVKKSSRSYKNARRWRVEKSAQSAVQRACGAGEMRKESGRVFIITPLRLGDRAPDDESCVKNRAGEDVKDRSQPGFLHRQRERLDFQSPACRVARTRKPHPFGAGFA